VRTDHKSLKEMQTQVIQTPEQQAWLPKLLGYNFDIEYKKGTENQAADGLSRSFMALSQPQPIFLHQLQQELITYDPYKEFPSAAGPNSKLQHKQGFWF